MRTINPAGSGLGTKAQRFARAIVDTRRAEGLSAAIRLAFALGAEIMLRPVTRRQDENLDRRLGIGTGRPSGSAPAEAPMAALGDGVAYSPTPSRLFTRILRGLPVRRPASCTFIDLGCGKGRTLLLAAEHGYGRVVGVELDPTLADDAARNVRAYESSTPERTGIIEVVGADAARYEFPAEPTVLFLFNPFGEDTLRAVVDRIEQSLAQHSRPFVVAYFNPMHHHVLDGSAVLTMVAKRARWATYANSEALHHL